MDVADKLERVVKALREIARSRSKAPLDDYLGNETDAHEWGVDVGMGYAGDIAREALKEIGE